MEPLRTLSNLDQIALLGDLHRLAILRRLMVGPATLSQLARVLGTYPARVRHHLKKMEDAGLLVLASTQVTGGYVEKFYQASAQAYLIQTAVAPAHAAPEAIIAMGSNDLALETLTQELAANRQVPDLFAFSVGSLDGLIALRQGLCQLAGAHLLDDSGHDYNLSYVRHLFPGRSMTLLTLAYRQQGLVTAAGNPRQIRSLADLARPDVTFINRQSGSGTRLWLERQLRQLGVSTDQVRGYQQCATTHQQVAEAVAQGRADVGLAILAVAQSHTLHFLPLFEERYELVLPTASLANPTLQSLLDTLQTAAFRQTLARLGGYEAASTGSRRDVV
jgi:putative molybdopterin biosynthesis protein